ncbi:AMIN-like domain-containing (lipo)protein [Cellulomonas sp. P4]|uniref:AMIN-like domain-containing (lipo)protein n=1 Tax=Cellulomonas sp. P4 TaxID=3142533 RepID=UPI0031BA2343
MMTVARGPLLAVLVPAALLLAACGRGAAPDAGPDDASAPPSASAPAATPSPGTDRPAPAPSGTATRTPAGDSGTDAEPSDDAQLTVTGLRSGTHPGFDRVVVDLTGTGTPGWHVERQHEAVTDPTGEVVDLTGDGVLALTVTGLGYPHETGATQLAPGSRAPGGTVVTGAEFTGMFEGQAQVFLGLTDPSAPYEVSLLDDPLRIVVDVQRSVS